MIEIEPITSKPNNFLLTIGPAERTKVINQAKEEKLASFRSSEVEVNGDNVGG